MMRVVSDDFGEVLAVGPNFSEDFIEKIFERIFKSPRPECYKRKVLVNIDSDEGTISYAIATVPAGMEFKYDDFKDELIWGNIITLPGDGFAIAI